MTKKSKKAITPEMKKLIEASAPKAVELSLGDDNNLTVVVNPIISIGDRGRMVREIANMVFVDAKDENGEVKPRTIDSYSPEFLKLARRYTTLKYFTNMALPSSLDEIWLLVYYTPIYAKVEQIIKDNLTDIFEEADMIIEANKQYLVGKTDINNLFGRLSSVVDNLGHQFSDTDVSKLMDVINKISQTSSGDILKEVVNTQTSNQT